VYKVSSNIATCHVNSVDGATSLQNVANLWKPHFQHLYSSGAKSKFRSVFDTKLKSCLISNVDTNTCVFSIYDIVEALNEQKSDKAPGPDGINMEAFIFRGHSLEVLSTILFGLFSLYGYVPDAFYHVLIVPLVKCKTGDLSDVSNCRAIFLSNAVTKIQESLLFSFIESQDVVDEYQFGFKKNYSMSICMKIFSKLLTITDKMAVTYLPALLIFTKACDNIDFWILFCKLIDNNYDIACYVATRLLA
jgi:hypothetical protein